MVAAPASHGTPPRSSDASLTPDLLALLLPGVDAQALIGALVAERDTGSVPVGAAGRELGRVRALLARGETTRELQHAFNNPLTALLAEAELLLLEELNDEARAGVERMLSLSRRLASITRQLGPDVIGAAPQ